MFPDAKNVCQLTTDKMMVAVGHLIDTHSVAIIKGIETAALNGSFSCTYNLPMVGVSSDDAYQEMKRILIAKLHDSGYAAKIVNHSILWSTYPCSIMIDWSGKQRRPPPKKP